MNHIHYMTSGEPTSIDALQQSNLASIRLRICPSIRAMLNKQWKVTAGDQMFDNPKKIVVTKIGANDIHKRTKEWLKQIESHKSGGAQIYLDYTDHHLGFESPMSDFYSQVMALVDKVIVPSMSMQNALASLFKKKLILLKTPLNFQFKQPNKLIDP